MEKYDVVHARLLMLVVNQAGGDPRPVIRNLMKLVSTCGLWRSQSIRMIAVRLMVAPMHIEPGGYIQWEEPNNDDRKLVKSDPSNPSEHVEQLLAGLNARIQPKSA